MTDDLSPTRRRLVAGALFAGAFGFGAARPRAAWATSARTPAIAARAFLDGLDAAGFALAAHPFEARRAVKWTPRPRDGVPLKRLSEDDRRRGFDILASVLSPDGFATVETLLAREAALAEIEQNPAFRDPGLYYVVVFGRPEDRRWSFRFEGHHLSLAFVFEGDALAAATPMFLGANPERLDRAGAAATVLSPVRDLARTLAQRCPPGDLAGAGARVAEIPQGGEMTAAILDFYLGRVRADLVAELRRDMLARSGSLRLRWSESAFTLEGGGLALTFAEQGTPQHIHSLLRDAGRDHGGSAA